MYTYLKKVYTNFLNNIIIEQDLKGSYINITILITLKILLIEFFSLTLQLNLFKCCLFHNICNIIA